MTPAAWNDYLAGHALATADALAGIKWRTHADVSRYGAHYARGYTEGMTRHALTI